MPIEITIPRLGWNMDEGVFAGWLKQDGEAVRAGEALFSLEGEKSTQEIEAMDPGVLRVAPNGPAPGETVAVGTLIGYLLAPGEPDPFAGARVAATATATAAATAPAPSHPQEQANSHTHIAAPRPGRDQPRSSPLARRVARELGIDWTRLEGSGRTGRIRKADVLAAARDRLPSGVRVAPEREPDGEPGRSVPLTPARRATAARMRESLQTAAPVTLTTTADATNLVSLRRQFKAVGPESAPLPGLTDFLVKLAALALRDHPMLHARWAGDRLVIPDEPNVGIAVDTDAGLFVPVIRGAAGLGLRELAARSRELIARARENRLRPSDTQGGTFTVSNLGAFGIEAFTPIINPPETAILGLGRIERKPVFLDNGDRVVGREQMTLSLTFDHRVVDGAPAARFLQHLARLVENPGPWLMG
jgi:pyruvate dehydrogenase E2 component (dihydrolipoamide acetyltransferase)